MSTEEYAEARALYEQMAAEADADIAKAIAEGKL